MSFKPSITILVLNDLVWDLLDITLYLIVGELAADQALGGEESILGIDHGLTLCGDADKALTLLREADDGRGGTGTLERLEWQTTMRLMMMMERQTF